MKRILYLALKDMQQTLRDRLSFLFLLLMPIIFTLLFSFAFAPSGAPQGDTRPVVAILDQDGSRVSAGLAGLLEASGAVRLAEAGDAGPTELEEQVRSGDLAALVVVPSGYGAALQAGEPLRLTLVADAASSVGLSAQAAVQTAVARLTSAANIARSTADFDPAFAAALAAWQRPPVGVTLTAADDSGQDETQAAGPMSAANTAPGMMVQFGIAGLLTSGQMLVNERKSRCMQRLLTTHVARYEIMLGHFLAIFTIALVQFILLVAFGQIALRLDYLRQPLATLVMIVATALFVAGLGLLIGALAKSDEQAIIFALIPMFVFAGLGGAWVPLENTGKTFQLIGHFTPVAWALDGFKSITLHGLDVSAVWLPAGALLGYAVLFVGLAVWRFRFE